MRRIIKIFKQGAEKLSGGESLKSLLTCLLFAFAFSGTHALAEGTRAKYEAILYGGFTLPNNQYNDVGVASGFPGLAYGLGGEIHLNAKVAVGIDMLYESKGHIVNSSGTQTQYNLAYLNLPVELKWYPAPFLMFHAGPYLASLMIAATRQGGGTSSSVKSGFNNDYGLTGGMWIGAHATSMLEIGLDTRFDLGLANIDNNNNPSTSINTRATIFLLTFSFGL